MLVALFHLEGAALDQLAAVTNLSDQITIGSAFHIKVQRQFGLSLRDLVGDDIGVLQSGIRPSDQLDGFPQADVFVFRCPVPAVLIRGLSGDGIFLGKPWAALIVERLLHAVVWREGHHQPVLLFFQERLHIHFPGAEHVICIE